MKKVVFLGLIFVILGFSLLKTNAGNSPKSIKVTIPKNSWSFSPAEIRIKSGEDWEILINNTDSYSHGFNIEKIGLSSILPPSKTTKIKVNITEKGEYIFSCSVVCGQGHYRMTGKLIVE